MRSVSRPAYLYTRACPAHKQWPNDDWYHPKMIARENSQTNENQNCVSIAPVIELKTNYLPNDAFAPDTRQTSDIDRRRIIIRHNEVSNQVIEYRNRVIANRHRYHIPP